MRFQTPLVPARLIRRYKRFLADAVLEDDGREITAHAPNPGAMLGLAEHGTRIWLEPNDDPKKKLKFGWRLVELEGGHFAGIDTSVPNRVVAEALRDGHIPALRQYGNVRAEVPYSERSRVDFLLTQPDLPDLYLEIKNVHLRRHSNIAEFPDCVTTRGAKHLGDLAQMVAQGHRACMLYLVQRTDCIGVSLAGDLDPAYKAAFQKAHAAGVDVIVLGTNIDTDGITAGKILHFHL